MFPELKWGFVSGYLHTVVVGRSEDCEQPEWVLDILHFRRLSAQQSLDFAKYPNGKYYDSLSRNVSSFAADPEAAYQEIELIRKGADIQQGNEGIEFIEMLIKLQWQHERRAEESQGIRSG